MVIGLHEYERAMQLFNQKNYEESEAYLREALKILKNANQEKSMGYMFILRKLAHVCFCNRKYSDSEKYF